MKKVTLIVLSLAVGIVLAISTAWSQEDMTVVDNSAFNSPQRPSSVFIHDTHNENADITDCASCHHVYKDGKLVEGESSEGQSCSECHKLHASNGQPSLREAFHTRCIGCHKSENKGPIMCGECHVRKDS